MGANSPHSPLKVPQHSDNTQRVLSFIYDTYNSLTCVNTFTMSRNIYNSHRINTKYSESHNV